MVIATEILTPTNDRSAAREDSDIDIALDIHARAEPSRMGGTAPGAPDTDRLTITTRIRNFIRARLRNQYHQHFLPKLREGLAETPLIYGPCIPSRTERLARVHMAANVGLNDVVMNVGGGTITLEEHVFFGHGVSLLAGRHDPGLRGVERMLICPTEGLDIVIETGAWIASNVTVLGPVRIGAHAVVCAGAVVRADVAPGEIVGGVPARHIGWIPGAADSVGGISELSSV